MNDDFASLKDYPLSEEELEWYSTHVPGVFKGPHTEETKRQISIRLSQTLSKPEQKERMRTQRSGSGNNFFGKRHRKEVVEAMSKQKKDFYSTEEGTKMRNHLSTYRGDKHHGTGKSRSEATKRLLAERNKGQVPYNKGKSWYHNPNTKQTMFLAQNESVPEGFICGRGNSPRKI